MISSDKSFIDSWIESGPQKMEDKAQMQVKVVHVTNQWLNADKRGHQVQQWPFARHKGEISSWVMKQKLSLDKLYFLDDIFEVFQPHRS